MQWIYFYKCKKCFGTSVLHLSRKDTSAGDLWCRLLLLLLYYCRDCHSHCAVWCHQFWAVTTTVWPTHPDPQEDWHWVVGGRTPGVCVCVLDFRCHFLTCNNSNNRDVSVYHGDVIMAITIVRVLRNEHQIPVNCQTKPTDLRSESAFKLLPSTAIISIYYYHTHAHTVTHIRFMALFRDHPGETVPEEIFFWSPWCKGRY